MQLTDKLTLKLPLLQAPLTAYPNQCDLVIASSNNGALGIYSSDLQSLEEIKTAITHIKAQTSAPFGVLINLSESDIDIDLADRSSTNTYLKLAYQALNIDASEATAFPDVNAICKAVVSAKPPVLIFQNGLPSDEFIEHCQRNNIVMLAIASNILEAIAIDNSHIDGIILQGLESAGIQSQFDNDLQVTRYPANTLLHHSLQHVSKPLIVWGDCQNFTAAQASLTCGASAVMLDVPFWTTHESPIPTSYRQRLATHNEMLITNTSIWQGQPAHVLQNALTKKYQSRKCKTLPLSKQQRLMHPVIAAAIAQDNADYMPLWAGLCAEVSNTPTAELCQSYACLLEARVR